MPITLNFPMIQNPPILKADISRYQSMYAPDGTLISHFDMQKYATKSRVITLRGGVAADGLDWEYEYNLSAAVLNDVFVDDVYHYTKLWKNIDAQSTIIQDMVDIARGIAPDHYLNRVTLDIEQNDGLDKNTFTGNAEKLASKVYSKTGIIPTIYTRAYFWNANTYMASWMKDCPLWDAHHFYGLDPYNIPAVRPYVPDAWAKINNPIPPLWWQFDTHDNGAEWGSTGDNEIDLNFFTYDGGTPAAFEKYYKVNYPAPQLPPPPPPPPGDLIPLKQVVITSTVGLNVRSLPDSASTDIGTLVYNSDVPVFDEQNGFYRIDGWISKQYTRDK